MTHRSSAPRRRPCGAQSKGNVSPLTTLDRHTGRAALEAQATNALLINAAISIEAEADSPPTGGASDISANDVSVVAGSARHAGRRDKKWCPPPRERGSGEGAARDGVNPAAEGGIGGALYSRYSGPKCTDARVQPEREAWLGEVEQHTRAFRAAKAQEHRSKAFTAFLAGESSRARWHLIRAHGQLERFERVRCCRLPEILVTCDDCGAHGLRIPARCSQRRLCVQCRGAAAANFREDIRAARSRALGRTRHLRWPGAPGGEWRERFLTLTIRHSGDIERDVASISAAWRMFRRKLWSFFEHEYHLRTAILRELRFVRVLEITPGRRNEGHAHFHVYLLSPFLPHEFVRHAWGEILGGLGYETPMMSRVAVLDAIESKFRRQCVERLLTTRGGQPLAEVHWPSVDIEECYGDVAHELVKYLIKDAELRHGELTLIDPALGARIYKALEGVRTLATSRGFIIRERKACFCEECGGTQLSRRILNKEEVAARIGATAGGDA